MIKLRTQEKVKEGAIKDEETAREKSGRELRRCAHLPSTSFVFMLADSLLAPKKEQVDAVTAEYSTVKETISRCRLHLSQPKVLLQTLVKDLPSSFV